MKNFTSKLRRVNNNVENIMKHLTGKCIKIKRVYFYYFNSGPNISTTLRSEIYSVS